MKMDLLHIAVVKNGNEESTYLEGYRIYKKPVSARYECSLDVMRIVLKHLKKERQKPK